MKIKPFILILSLVFMGHSLSIAQKRSRLPRIKVKADQSLYTQTPPPNHLREDYTTVSALIEESKITMDDLGYVSINDEAFNISPSRCGKCVFKEVKKVHPLIGNHHSKAFQNQLLLTHQQLLKVKDVKKSALELWAILLIVLYILGLIFTILCVVAWLVWGNYTLFIVFLILSLVLILAGSIILTLGQLGIM
ncbi:MAG: hypothetical protein LC101_11550 [Flavobacteriales bacterium]|nr:hypothetical protein [Flavobacteriales bacterium]MCZ2444398.1 hypothetical protein [Flavobacteriales bacterium]